jgi:hypothetical protein
MKMRLGLTILVVAAVAATTIDRSEVDDRSSSDDRSSNDMLTASCSHSCTQNEDEVQEQQSYWCSSDSDCLENSVCQEGVCQSLIGPSGTDPVVRDACRDIIGQRCWDSSDCLLTGGTVQCGECIKHINPNDGSSTCTGTRCSGAWTWTNCGDVGDSCGPYSRPCCAGLWCEHGICTAHFCRREGEICDDTHVSTHCCERDNVYLDNICVKLPNCQNQGEYCNKDHNLNCCTQLGLTCDPVLPRRSEAAVLCCCSRDPPALALAPVSRKALRSTLQ